MKKKAIQINLLSDMATIAENTLIINSPADLEAEMCRYNCPTKEELEEEKKRKERKAKEDAERKAAKEAERKAQELAKQKAIEEAKKFKDKPISF